MNLLDRVIGYFAPDLALRREMLRQYLGEVRSQAVALDRLRAQVTLQNLAPNQEVRVKREQVLLTARELDRSNSWAHGVFNSIVDNIVGDGITLVPMIGMRRGKGKLNEEANDRVEEEWNEWSDGVDLERKLTMGEVQRWMEREAWVAGEFLIVFTTVNDGRRIPLALDMIESERLATIDEPPNRNGVEIVQGVELDAQRRVLAYHIWDRHPGEDVALKARRIPADRVLHFRSQARVGAVRGMSRIYPVARIFEALAQYLDFTLTRARLASSFALMIKRSRGGGLRWPGKDGLPALPSASASQDKSEGGMPMVPFYGGMILQGGPQDSLEGTPTNVVDQNFDPFVTLCLRAEAVGLNVSYEILARDFSRANFSSTRQSFLEDQKHWKPRQKFLITKGLKPIFRQFATHALIAGVEPFQTLPEKLLRMSWRPPGWPWIDPVDEVTAEKEGVKGGFNSPQRVCSSHGLDFFEIVDELAEAKEYAEKKGVELDVFMEKIAEAAAAGAKPKLFDKVLQGKKDAKDAEKKRRYQAA